MWLFDLFFPQFCKSDISRYGYLKVFQSPLDVEITRVDCTSFISNKFDVFYCLKDNYIVAYFDTCLILQPFWTTS